MSAPPVITVKADLSRLAYVNRLVMDVSGKSADEVLAKEARETSWEFYNQLRAIPPGTMARARSIGAAAKLRHFEMGRIGNSLTKARAGISAVAWEAAERLMDGQKSEFFKVSDNDGMPVLRRARFSGAQGKRNGRLLKGGRFGNRFAKSAKKGSQLEAETLKRELDLHPEVKRLNLRAVATANEIRLRAMAAKGGTMGIQFLPRFYQRTKSATVKNGPLVQHNERTNITLGQLDFDQKNGQLIGLKWTAYVPGTAEVIERNNILAKVEAARVADRMKYIERKLKEGFDAAK